MLVAQPVSRRDCLAQRRRDSVRRPVILRSDIESKPMLVPVSSSTAAEHSLKSSSKFDTTAWCTGGAGL